MSIIPCSWCSVRKTRTSSFVVITIMLLLVLPLATAVGGGGTGEMMFVYRPPLDVQSLAAVSDPASVAIEWTDDCTASTESAVRDLFQQGATIFVYGDQDPLRAALGLGDENRTETDIVPSLYAVRRLSDGVLSDLIVLGGARNVATPLQEYVTALSGNESIAANAPIERLREWMAPTESEQALAPQEQEPGPGWVQIGDQLDVWNDTTYTSLSWDEYPLVDSIIPWYQTLRKKIYKLLDNEPGRDFYLVTFKMGSVLPLEHQRPDNIANGWTMWKRGLSLTPESLWGNPPASVIEHEPVNAAQQVTTSWSIGDEFSVSAGVDISWPPGVSGSVTWSWFTSYSESWTNPCVGMKDVSSQEAGTVAWQEEYWDLTRGSARWWELPCPPYTYTSRPWTVDCDANKETYYSHTAAIFEKTYDTGVAPDFQVRVGETWSYYYRAVPNDTAFWYEDGPDTVCIGPSDGGDYYYTTGNDGSMIPYFQFGRNLGPVVYENSPEWTPVEVEVGEYLDFSVAAQDSDGCQLTYEWFMDDDTLDTGGEPELTYRPICSDPATRRIICRATDPNGAYDEHQWNVQVHKKVADYLPSTPTWTALEGTNWCPGQPVTLTASDVDQSVTWEWSSSCGGHFYPPNGNPTAFVPPATTAPMICQISVIAHNDCGPSDPGIASGTIYPIPGTPSLTFFPATPQLCCGNSIQLNASGSGDPAYWFWECPDGGTIVGNGATVIYTAPTVTAERECDVMVRSQNLCGMSDPVVVTLMVQPAPEPPALTTPADSEEIDLPGGDQPLVLLWEEAEGVTLNRVQIDDNTDLSSPEFDNEVEGCSYCTYDLAKGKLYYWRVKAASGCGWGKWSDIRSFYLGTATGVTDINGNLPEDYQLAQNYPNPFNPTTAIEFSLPSSETVLLEIYDITGRKVRTLVDSHLNAGLKRVVWDSRNDLGNVVSSGLYLYRLQAGTFTDAKKMVLLR